MENSKFEIPWPVLAPLFVAAALVCAGSFPLDGCVVAFVAAHPGRTFHHAAQFFTRWGDFPPLVVYLVVSLVAARLLNRTVAIPVLKLMLYSAITGGLAANILRFLTGRARPSAKVPPGWYGMWSHGAWIGGQYQYSSFPSAHTAVAIATIIPLWLCLPARNRFLIALPATLAALCVAASRIVLNAHHLFDVLCGAWLGALLSVLICARFGLSTKKLAENR
jgi:membrane-associated phospholipid phosphatase